MSADVLPAPLDELFRRFRSGERVGLARAISLVEDQREGFQAFLHAVLSRELRGRRLGVTGPPGAGKSSMVSAVARAYREVGDRVGVVAVDPTSPYSGGALLGDRIRMNDLSTDPGIFIRSMATRGSLGGLATTTKEVLDLMDGFGFERVLVETVGVGQTELEITSAADTVVVVLVPESGDAIQAMKAGLMEIADVFVVNKADRPGAERLVKEIGTSLRLRQGKARSDAPGHHGHHGVDVRRVVGKDASSAGASPGPEEPEWEIPVLKTVASTGEGIPDVVQAVDQHRAHLETSGELARRRLARAEARVREVVERELRRIAWEGDEVGRILREGMKELERDEATPYSLAGRVLEEVLGPGAAGRLPGA